MTIAQRQQKAEQLLRAAGILPVVTVHTLDEARKVSAALLKGGLPVIELTLRTPVAMEALAMLKKELPDIVIGAGTVLTIEQMEQSIAAGADFLVTPGTPAEMAEALAKAPIPVVPGAATPTELLSLMARGFRVCKLFPASAVGGLAMLKGLAGPLSDLKIARPAASPKTTRPTICHNRTSCASEAHGWCRRTGSKLGNGTRSPQARPRPQPSSARSAAPNRSRDARRSDVSRESMAQERSVATDVAPTRAAYSVRLESMLTLAGKDRMRNSPSFHGTGLPFTMALPGAAA